MTDIVGGRQGRVDPDVKGFVCLQLHLTLGMWDGDSRREREDMLETNQPALLVDSGTAPSRCVFNSEVIKERDMSYFLKLNWQS